MNPTRFDAYLANAVGDPLGKIYTQPLRWMAAQEAVRSYGHYNGLLRPIGSGGIWEKVPVGQNYILVVGGLFTVGQQLVLSFGLPWQETLTVASMAPYTDSGTTAGAPYQVNFTGNVVNAHNAGEYVYGINASVTSQTGQTTYNGLVLVANQNNYLMPLDFLSPEQDSFDVAFGLKPSPRRADTFGSPYPPTMLLSGVGIGQSQEFGPNFNYGWPTGVSMNGGAALGSILGWQTQEMTTTFTGDAMQILTINPAPTTGGYVQFGYYAQQQLETVPDAWLDALGAYAMYHLYNSRAGRVGQGLDYREGDVEENPSKTIAALNMLAKQALDKYEDLVRYQPRVMTG